MEFHAWHEINILSLMLMLGIDLETFPEPSSCIAFELHKKDEEEYIEVSISFK